MTGPAAVSVDAMFSLSVLFRGLNAEEICPFLKIMGARVKLALFRSSIGQF